MGPVSELSTEDLGVVGFPERQEGLQESRKASQRRNMDKWRKIRETRNLKNLFHPFLCE